MDPGSLTQQVYTPGGETILIPPIPSMHEIISISLHYILLILVFDLYDGIDVYLDLRVLYKLAEVMPN